MASSNESKKMITLRSSDGYEFEIEENVAIQSETIKFMIGDNCAESVIPLTNVNSKILLKVIEYIEKHVESTTSESDDKTADEELEAWDADFVQVDLPMLRDLMLAANFLEIKSLLDLICRTVADMIKGKTPEEIRKTFNIKNDFTPEEQEKMHMDNPWTFH